MTNLSATIAAFVVSFGLMFGYVLALSMTHWRASVRARASSQPKRPLWPSDSMTAETKPRSKIKVS